MNEESHLLINRRQVTRLSSQSHVRPVCLDPTLKIFNRLESHVETLIFLKEKTGWFRYFQIFGLTKSTVLVFV